VARRRDGFRAPFVERKHRREFSGDRRRRGVIRTIQLDE
jgi:hypothetical protein